LKAVLFTDNRSILFCGEGFTSHLPGISITFLVLCASKTSKFS